MKCGLLLLPMKFETIAVYATRRAPPTTLHEAAAFPKRSPKAPLLPEGMTRVSSIEQRPAAPFQPKDPAGLEALREIAAVERPALSHLAGLIARLASGHAMAGTPSPPRPPRSGNPCIARAAPAARSYRLRGMRRPSHLLAQPL